MASRRQLRVAEQLQMELAKIISQELNDPRLHFVTVTRVEVSGDLEHANVFISVLGSDEEEEESLEGLRHAQAYIRTLVAKRLPLRHVPELDFKHDKAVENTMRVWELLEGLKQDGDLESESDEQD